MGWSTNLFCNIIFNKETFNSKYQVEQKLKEAKESIQYYKDRLLSLVMITEPEKFFDLEDNNLIDQMRYELSDILGELEHYYVTEYKLELLLDNWDNCHDKEGYAINPPNDIAWDTAYLDGDFINNKETDENSRS